MKMKSDYPIAGQNFHRKKDVTLFFSEMLESHRPTETLNAEDGKMVQALFLWHPDYRAKTKGKRIKRFFAGYIPTEVEAGFVTAKCFHFETVDGKVDHFSY